ncbi:MAG: mobile mystery protein A [Acidimicrobiales bacterium]
MKRAERAAQARRELDRKLSAAVLGPIQTRPRSGWIRAVRGALGMSQKVLASRLGVAGPAVTKLEKSELNDTIGLGKLAEVARAMDCTLVYAFVPSSSLDDTVRRHARRVAAEALGYVGNTMKIENQELEADRVGDQIERQAQQIIDSNRVWSGG